MSSQPDPLWPRLEALFDEAVELPPDRRAELVDRIRREDPALGARLASLLQADAAAGSFLSGPAVAWVTSPPATDTLDDGLLTPGTIVGPYRIVREIGRGGMGVVYQAERADGEFQQRVALKVVRPGTGNAAVLTRFRRERQILARLEHPCIARLFDGGAHVDGRPYFAMELVEGEPITTCCQRVAMPVRDRIALFRRICDAVQYAHGNLVVHRDLKPSNIFVTPAGEPKLLDFGIAKVLTEDGDAESTELTQDSGRVFTPAYAAPEQVRREPITTATDVYGLGVILFELLTGRRPFATAGESVFDLERAVLEHDAPRPSSLVRGLDRDLDAIVLKALRKEPQHRYASAGALADDLARYHDGRPVAARPDGRRYRVGKFVRRHRIAIGAAALVVLSLISGLGATAWQARQKTLAAQEAEAVKNFLVSLFQQADPVGAAGRNVSLREVLDAGSARVEQEFQAHPEVRAELQTVLAGVYTELGVLDRAGTLAEEALKTHEQLYGPRHPRVANNLRQLASLAVARGDAAAGADLARRALAIHREHAGGRHADVAETLDVLVLALGQGGQVAEAVEAAEESLAIRRELFGEEHRLVAESMNNLAVLFRRQGRFEESAALYQQVLDMRRRLLGNEHPHVALTLHNFSALQVFRGEYQQAADLSREALEHFRRLYGDEHQLTLAARSTLATIDRVLGRYDTAEANMRSILEVWGRTVGLDHPNAMSTAGALARIHRERGQLAEAERVLRDLDARAQQRLGPNHPLAAGIRRTLGGVLADRGRVDEAGRLLQDALDTFRKVYGASHLEIAETLHELGLLARARGALDEAATFLNEAVSMRRTLVGDAHLATAQSLAALGEVQLRNSAYDEAALTLEQALPILERTLPADHPQLVAAHARLDQLRRVTAR